MKKIKDQNICIRLNRNEGQINKCKEQIESMDNYTQNFSKILRLAGNQVRMKILILLKEERLCVCDLSEILDMKVPAVSQHLRKLKDSGLLFATREGTIIYHYVNPQFKSILQNIFGSMPKSKAVTTE